MVAKALTSLPEPELVPPALSLREVAALDIIPSRRNGTRLHVATLTRWILHGSRGVRLRARRVGGQWTTCRAWVEEFISESTARELGLQPPGAAASRRATEKKLRAAGAMK